MKIKKVLNEKDCDVLILGEKYRGELLMCDYGFSNLEEDDWYVVLSSNEVEKV